jgi:hypothetical protein
VTLDGLHADFESHHIEGHARAAADAGRSSYFRVPLVSQIDGNLWMGGCIDGVRLGPDFKFVVSLYPWEQYELTEGTVRSEHRLYDAAEMPDLDELDRIVTGINVRCHEGRTLVHCQAGLNRSGLVTAFALVKRGMLPADAIALLREKRCPLVLCNGTFERWLLGLGELAA